MKPKMQGLERRKTDGFTEQTNLKWLSGAAVEGSSGHYCSYIYGGVVCHSGYYNTLRIESCINAGAGGCWRYYF